MKLADSIHEKKIRPTQADYVSMQCSKLSSYSHLTPVKLNMASPIQARKTSGTEYRSVQLLMLTGLGPRRRAHMGNTRKAGILMRKHDAPKTLGRSPVRPKKRGRSPRVGPVDSALSLQVRNPYCL